MNFNWSALDPDELESVLGAADPSRIAWLETDYLLEYAAEDTDITWMFYTHVLKPGLDKFKAYADYHKEYFIPLVEHHAIQQLGGIWIDTEHMANVKEELLAKQSTYLRNILEHPTIRAGIDMFNNAVLQNMRDSKPAVCYRKVPDRKPEPKKFTQAGHVSRNWKAWYALEEEIARLTENPEPLPRFTNWAAKVKVLEDAIARYDELTPEEIKEHSLFSLTSTDDKRWLFYNALSFPVLVYTYNKFNPEAEQKPSVDESAMKGMGEIGELFIEWQGATKELQFVESLTSRLYGDIFHPQFKVPGTYTGRLSGAGGFSMQILPKTPSFLEAFRPRPGHKLVDIDLCYEASTEILTKEGWKTFDKVTIEDDVWQVNHVTLEGSWTKPKRVIWKPYTGVMHSICNRRGELTVTEGHKMLYLGQQSARKSVNRRIVQPAEADIGMGFEIATGSFGATSSKTYTKEDIWIACMLQADGSLYNHNRPTPKFSIEVSRPEKRDMVRHLLKRDGIVRPPRPTQTMPTEKWHSITPTSDLVSNSKDKLFNLTGLGIEHAEEFLSALSFWDGSIDSKDGSIYYTSKSNLANLDRVQAYLTRCGYECKILKVGHTVRITKPVSGSPTFRLRPVDKLSRIVTDTYVGCVEVESGFIQVRSKGQVFVCGNCALEPVVLTELSRDEGLLSVYGPNASPHADIYLTVGARLGSVGQAFRDCGYDYKNPTKEAASRCKKEHKNLRGIVKKLHLSASYGAGPRKIHEALALDGVSLSLDEVRRMHSEYWEMFGSIKQYEQRLVAQWEKNGGWFLNGLGLPATVAQDKIKDIINRQVQGTGHTILTFLQKQIADDLAAEGIPYRPYVFDFHDEIILEVPDAHAKRTYEIMDAAFKKMNKTLQDGSTVVQFKGSGDVMYSLAEAKIEDYKSIWRED